MKNTIITAALCLILLVPIVNASTVSRSFSVNPAYTGTVLTVNLDVDITSGLSIYAIKEEVLPGWRLYDNGSGKTDEPGLIKWLYYNKTVNASDTVYSYKVIAPSSVSNHQFNGTYIFEGMSGETETLGSKDISVIYGAGDVDPPGGNNCVDLFDLIAVGLDYGKTDPPYTDPQGDANFDNVVDIYDLVVVGTNFGNDYGGCPP